MRILDVNRSFACFDKKVFLKTSCLLHCYWQIQPLSVARHGDHTQREETISLTHTHMCEKNILSWSRKKIV